MEALAPHRVLMLQEWELHLQSSVGQEPLTNLHLASVCFHSPSLYPTPSLCPSRFLYCYLEPCSFLQLEGLGPSSVKDLRIPTAQVTPWLSLSALNTWTYCYYLLALDPGSQTSENG